MALTANRLRRFKRLGSGYGEKVSPHSNTLALESQKRENQIGRWLSQKGGRAAKPEDVVRAIRAAAAAGSGDPIPYIEATLRNEAAGGVRREGDDWRIPHGTEEYQAHRRHLAKINSPEIYRWPDTPGHVARAKSRWPVRISSGPQKAVGSAASE